MLLPLLLRGFKSLCLHDDIPPVPSRITNHCQTPLHSGAFVLIRICDAHSTFAFAHTGIRSHSCTHTHTHVWLRCTHQIPARSYTYFRQAETYITDSLVRACTQHHCAFTLPASSSSAATAASRGRANFTRERRDSTHVLCPRLNLVWRVRDQRRMCTRALFLRAPMYIYISIGVACVC